MSKRSVLLVDDEPMVLLALERILGTLLDCRVVKAEDGPQALAILEREPFDIVVSDMAMPGMSGATLLDIVHELYPRAMRLVLSGRSSRDQGLSTVGSAHQYFLKPGDVSAISRRLKNVLALRELLPPEGLGTVIAGVDTLPSCPEIFRELEEEINKPDASAEAIGRIVEKDVAMSAKALQLVNSSFFGLREHVSSPVRAVVLLGASLMKSLVLAVHVFSSVPKDDPLAAFVRKVWTHSLHVATAAREIALFEKAPPALVEEAYIAGLFHDIGKLAIAMNLPDARGHIEETLAERELADAVAERETLGATHAEAGGYLLALWGFSDAVVEAAVFHHQPSRSGKKAESVFPTLAAVHVANAFDHEKEPARHAPNAAPDTAFLQNAGLADKPAAWRAAIGG